MLIISYTVYKNHKEIISDIDPEKPLRITLKKTVRKLDEVQITTGTFEASERKKAVLLNSLDIATTASSDATI